MESANQVLKELKSIRNKEYAAHAQRFFRTGPGEYGEGDVFLGIRVPDLRRIAKESKFSISEAEKLLHSEYHEARMVALIILERLYVKADEKMKTKIFNLYKKSIHKYINNWDLVDISAHKIIGRHLESRSKDQLLTWAKSSSLWERRVAMIATFWFLKDKDCTWTYKIAKILLKDEHDLIHKAVGWGIREAGKACGNDELESFIQKYGKHMPRTMLRYAIEKFPEAKRKKILEETKR